MNPLDDPAPGAQVAVVAVASNEAPYLHEFVAHALHAGFARVHLMTNNSTDGTHAIAARIADAVPKVTAQDVDAHRRKNGEHSLQTRAYNVALRSLLKEGGLDYVMPLDIDEYWVGGPAGALIGPHLDALGRPEAVAYNWAVARDDDAPFTAQTEVRTASVAQPLKTATRTDLPDLKLRVHHAVSSAPFRTHVASGRPFETTPDGREIRDRTRGRHTALPGQFVLHRPDRSAMEYVAAIARGSAHRAGETFKRNRRGYRSYDRLPAHPIPGAAEVGAAVARTRDALVLRCGLSGAIVAGRRHLRRRAAEVARTLLGLDGTGRDAISPSFAGLTEAMLRQIARGAGG